MYMKDARIMEQGQPSRNHGGLKLATIVVVISLIWLVALPRISRFEIVRKRIEHFQDRGIEPAAFFYDDHPASRRWENEVKAATEKNPAAFGMPVSK
jgi:hypothetical protein